MRTPLNILRYLVNSFNAPADRWSQPALKFERSANIRGIAANYYFPQGRTPSEFECWAYSFCSADQPGRWEKQFLDKTWAALVSLNAGLETVETNHVPALQVAAIHGAASLYNPEDINFFLRISKITGVARTDIMDYMASYIALHEDIQSRAGVCMEWVAAPQTLLKIYDQVKNRPVCNPIDLKDCRKPGSAVGKTGIFKGFVVDPTPEMIRTLDSYIGSILDRGGYCPDRSRVNLSPPSLHHP